MKKSNHLRINNGFSLLEMTVVLIVMSVLASAVIPVLTRSFLDKSSEKVSLDISAIQDAARAYYIANNSWPTSIIPTGVTPASDLESNSYLPSGWNAKNPFGNVYTSSASGSVFTVSTQVANGSQIGIINRLPASSYSGNVVSSSVPVPGSQVNGGFGAPVAVNIGQSYTCPKGGIVEANIDCTNYNNAQGGVNILINGSTVSSAYCAQCTGCSSTSYYLDANSATAFCSVGGTYEITYNNIFHSPVPSAKFVPAY